VPFAACTYDGHAVVKQRFAEDDDLEHIIDVDRLKNSDDGDRINSGQ